MFSADRRWYHGNENADNFRDLNQIFYRFLAVKDGRKIHQAGVVSPGKHLLYPLDF